MAETGLGANPGIPSSTPIGLSQGPNSARAIAIPLNYPVAAAAKDERPVWFLILYINIFDRKIGSIL